MRARTGANVVAVEHDGSTTRSPDPSSPVQPGDRLLALGSPAAIERLRELLERQR